MRARPRRETPSSKPRPRTGPFTSPPIPRASPSASGSSKRQETVLLNASVGVQRVIGRVRRSSSQESTRVVQHSLSQPGQSPDPRPDGFDSSLLRSHRRRRTFVLPALALPRHLAMPRLAIPRHLSFRTTLRRLGHERMVAIAVAGIVLGASFLSVAPGRPERRHRRPDRRRTGTPSRRSAARSATAAPVRPRRVARTSRPGRRDHRCGAARLPPAMPPRSSTPSCDSRTSRAAPRGTPAVAAPPTVEGPFLDDGTLLKPVAVDTSVADGSDLIRTYKVKAGDTLAGIADEVRRLDHDPVVGQQAQGQERPRRGQELEIPPVSGSSSRSRRPTPSRPSPRATRSPRTRSSPRTSSRTATSSSARCSSCRTPRARRSRRPSPSRRPAVRPAVRSGEQWRQPRTACDRPRPTPAATSPGRPRAATSASTTTTATTASTSTASTGDPIFAAASGTVTFAGWKNNGGGYQVWISHGSGLYTTYNHMSSVSVGRGQHVGRGQRVGRMGATGYRHRLAPPLRGLEGPDLGRRHRVNPLAYL